MKTIQLIVLIIFSNLISNYVVAQVPIGYNQGSIILTDGTKKIGFIKDEIAKKGMIFLEILQSHLN